MGIKIFGVPVNGYLDLGRDVGVRLCCGIKSFLSDRENFLTLRRIRKGVVSVMVVFDVNLIH